MHDFTPKDHCHACEGMEETLKVMTEKEGYEFIPEPCYCGHATNEDS